MGDPPKAGRKYPSWGCWSVVLASVAGAASAFYFLLPYTAIGGLFGLQPPLFAKRGAYLRIVDATKAGTLKPDSRGVIVLKGEFAGVTAADEALHERKVDGRDFFIFPVWYGRGNDLQDYLFTTTPLLARDYYPVNGYSVIDACDRSVLNVTPKGGAWYWVIRRMD